MAFWPFGYTEATNVDEDNDFSGGGGLLRAGKRQRRWKFKTIREYLQDALVFINGIRLKSSSVVIDEIESDPLSVDGWYTIAETGTDSFRSVQAKFMIEMSGSARRESMTSMVNINNDTTAKTHNNATVKILGISFPGSRTLRFRAVKSDSVEDAGTKVQVYVDVNVSVILRIQKLGNLQNGKGFELVDPVLENAPILPDDVTAGTFLEAGEEYNFGINGMQPLATAIKITNDQMACVMQWPENVKIGTNISFSNIAGIRLSQGTTIVDVPGGATISNYVATKNNISFRINSVGAFSTFSLQALTGFRTTIDNIKAIII